MIYVIKENRTYDQILGDLKVGNGDPSLTMYGADITPNEHKLALQFGVLDNFYDSGEVSGDGHLWSTAAITSDYNEKTWQIAYRGKERTYDFGGTVADEFPLDHNQPDIDDPGTGYLWDNLARHGLTYRDYGEFVSTNWCNKIRKAESPKQGTPSAQDVTCDRTELHKGDLLAAQRRRSPRLTQSLALACPAVQRREAHQGGPAQSLRPALSRFQRRLSRPAPRRRIPQRVRRLRASAPEKSRRPNSNFPLSPCSIFPTTTPEARAPSTPRPAASVADNDLALGRVVDAVSHSPYWDDTAIFILEDDAQNGGDHVDAHRSIAFVISKYSPGTATEPYLDHRFYTTVNLIHTMEMLLGLPPMNLNDAYAPAMGPMFSGAGTQPPFQVDDRNLKNGLIYEINPPNAKGAAESAAMDFSRPDAAATSQLNKVLWTDQKGDVPPPSPKHTMFPAGD